MYVCMYVWCDGNVYDVLCVIELEAIPTSGYMKHHYMLLRLYELYEVILAHVKPLCDACGGSRHNEHTSRGYCLVWSSLLLLLCHDE